MIVTNPPEKLPTQGSGEGDTGATERGAGDLIHSPCRAVWFPGSALNRTADPETDGAADGLSRMHVTGVILFDMEKTYDKV